MRVVSSECHFAHLYLETRRARPAGDMPASASIPTDLDQGGTRSVGHTVQTGQLLRTWSSMTSELGTAIATFRPTRNHLPHSENDYTPTLNTS